jgi:raffinose/stachyose/melibiose transport system substrate-binding protein
MKKGFSFLVVFLVVMTMCTAFAAPKTVNLSVMTNIPGAQAQVLQDICNEFMKANPNIKVDFSAPANQYENIMRVKMASKDLPDVFSTHGWAIKRYGAFLADLRREPWAAKIDPSIKPLVTDEKGKVYVLPMDIDKSGFVYNVDILNKYNIAVPKTLDELIAACVTIKAKSNGEITPIHIGGSDNWPEGQFYDYFATPALISPKTNYAKAFLNGTFDWNKFDILPAKFKEMWDKGLINKDFLTSKYMDSAKAIAAEKVAFAFYGGYVIDEAKKINPNIHWAMMPIPAMVPGDQPTLVGGEKTTWGIWKDSKNMAAAKKFVAWYAKPENIKRVAESNLFPAGINGVKADCKEMNAFYESTAKLRVFPYWDRYYLPSGMWEFICRNAQDLVSGTVNPRQFSQNMEKEFKRLRAAENSK